MKKLLALLLVVQIVVCIGLHVVFIEKRTMGTSMLPLFHDYDILLYNRFLPSNLTGMIVVFYSVEYEFHITHRTIADNGIHIETQGDNNRFPDEFPVSKNMVLGVYVRKMPISIFFISVIFIAITLSLYYFLED